MVYRRKGKPEFYLAVPTRSGSIKRSAGTTDRATAKAIERMLHALGPQGARAWDLLDPVADRSLSLGDLYDAWRANDLEGLRARRADVDLAAHIPGWESWLTDRVKPATTGELSGARSHADAGRPTVQPLAAHRAGRRAMARHPYRALRLDQTALPRGPATLRRLPRGSRRALLQSTPRRDGPAGQCAALRVPGAARRAARGRGRAPALPRDLCTGLRRRPRNLGHPRAGGRRRERSRSRSPGPRDQAVDARPHRPRCGLGVAVRGSTSSHLASR